MQLMAFNGGLNTRIDPALIKASEATIYQNINSDTAVLTPIKDKTLSVNSISRYSYYDTISNQWYSNTTPTDYLEYQEVLYKADRLNAPVKILSGTEYQLGITAPVGTLTVTPTSAPEALERVTFTSGNSGGSDLPAGQYKYKVVNRDSVTGLVSYSYFRTPIAEASVKPSTFGGRPFNIAGSTIAGTRYTTYKFGIVVASDNEIAITFEDTNADEVRVYRYFDGAWRALTTDFQSAATTVTDNVYDISANEELNDDELLTGTIQYAVTYYNSATGAESAPLISPEAELVNGTIALTTIPVSADPQVTQKRIYRIGGNLTAFSLVATITNATTTYNDVTADTEIIGTILTSVDYDPAPVGLKYLIEAYAMLFGAVGDKLRYTPIGKPDAWPENFFLDFPETITGISKTAIGLLIHTKYVTYLVTGTGPTSFAQQVLANDQGCVSHDSIQETKDTALWLSTDGICASDGSDVKVLSRDKLGKQTLVPVNAILYDQVYQLLLSDQTVLSLDFERGIFKQFSYSVDFLVVAEDVLYGHNSGKLYSLNTNINFLTMVYKSPDFKGPGLTIPKVYSDLFMYSSGTVTVQIFIDNVLVVTHTKTTEDLHQLKIPKEKLRGKFISFRISGTGEVRELRWDDGIANG